jgi:hypothetical protein
MLLEEQLHIGAGYPSKQWPEVLPQKDVSRAEQAITLPTTRANRKGPLSYAPSYPAKSETIRKVLRLALKTVFIWHNFWIQKPQILNIPHDFEVSEQSMSLSALTNPVDISPGFPDLRQSKVHMSRQIPRDLSHLLHPCSAPYLSHEF